jgi:sugar phosphate isomerase/epimerase
VKLGCSSVSYEQAFADGTLDLFGWLDHCARELEVDGVEFVDAHLPTADPAFLRELKRRCTELQLVVASFAVTSDIAGASDRAAELDRVRRWCDAAAFLGAPVVRVSAGRVPVPAVEAGLVPRLLHRIIGQPRPNARRIWSDLTFSLRDLADHAEERGVMVAVENSRAGRIVGTALALDQCVRDVGSPWLAVALDPADLGTRVGIEAALERTVLVSARIRQIRDDGSDPHAHWPGLLQLLRLGHYGGFVHLRYEGSEPALTAVPRAARYLRGLMLLLARQQLLQGPDPEDGAGAADAAAAEVRLEQFRRAEASPRR